INTRGCAGCLGNWGRGETAGPSQTVPAPLGSDHPWQDRPPPPGELGVGASTSTLRHFCVILFWRSRIWNCASPHSDPCAVIAHACAIPGTHPVTRGVEV